MAWWYAIKVHVPERNSSTDFGEKISSSRYNLLFHHCAFENIPASTTFCGNLLEHDVIKIPVLKYNSEYNGQAVSQYSLFQSGGSRKISGIYYADGVEVPKRSKRFIWRAAVEMSRNTAQLSTQVCALPYVLLESS